MKVAASILLCCTTISHAQISSFPYREHFDTVAVPGLPSGWMTTSNKAPGPDFSTTGTARRSTPNCVVSTDSKISQSLISPSFNFSGKHVDSIEFFERRSSTHTSGVMLEASLNGDTSFSVTLADTFKLTAANDGKYQRRSIALPAILDDQPDVKFRWRVVGNGSGSSATIKFDDIAVTLKKSVDLAVASMNITPATPRRGDSVAVLVGITNKAFAGNYTFTLQLFDSVTLIDSKEISHTFFQNDSMTVPLHFPNISSGRHGLSAKLFLPNDEDSSNNFLSIVVIAGEMQRRVLINEILYAPADGKEWIECINNSSEILDLAGWKISDRSTSTPILTQPTRIAPYQYFVLAKDTTFKNNFPDVSCPIIPVASLPILNNDSDAIVLLDPTGIAVDSVFYHSFWGGNNGKSLERVDTGAASVDQSNWKSSRHPLGATPGKINSVTKKEFDAAVDQIVFVPPFPVAGQEIDLKSTIKNVGRQTLTNIKIDFYRDANKDSIVTPNELMASQSVGLLSPKDSTAVVQHIPSLPQSTHWIFASVSSNRDDDSSNNILRATVTVGIVPYSIVINEILYAPTGDMPEWIELYNTSGTSIDLSGWKISDAGPTKALIAGSQKILSSTSYAVVTTDTIALRNYFSLPVSVPLLQASFSALNNSSPDAVVLHDERGSIIDSVLYTPHWGGTNGHSLQRCDALASSNDSVNWRSELPSIGIENSCARKDFDVEVRTISSLHLSNGTRIGATIYNPGRQTASPVTVKFFHDTNRGGTAQQNELLSSVNVPSITPMESVSVWFDWIHTLHGKQSVIVSAEFYSDQRLSNNTKSEVLISSFPPQSIVINEIMYEPKTGNAEFVELHNPTNDTIDIAGWQLMDSPSASGSRAMIQLAKTPTVLLPHQYFLVASDSTIFSQWPSLDSHLVTVSNSLSLSNTGEDIVLVDVTNTLIDSISYFPSWHLKNITTSGRSLERINPLASGTDARNWSSSTAPSGASPGKQNSIYISTAQLHTALSLTPNPFSPDGDGFEDFLSINFSLPSQSSRVRIRIFDITGRLVRRLASDELTPANGSIVWNGMDDNGRKVRIGMYIILLEAIDNFGGVQQTLKDVAVVAAKL